MEIDLVACSKSKKTEPSIPKELYMKSDLFRKKRKYCETYHKKWYILSAKYYLLDPDGPVINPYDETLKGARKVVKEAWSRKIFNQLQEKGLLKNRLIIHAGKDYYEYLYLISVPILHGLKSLRLSSIILTNSNFNIYI